MTTRTALYAAFDATAGVHADLVLFDRDEPAAPEALRSWAAERGRGVVEKPIFDGGMYTTCLVVPLPAHREISVYVRS